MSSEETKNLRLDSSFKNNYCTLKGENNVKDKVKGDEDLQRGCWSSLYPTGFLQNLKSVLKSSAPLILQQTTIYMLAPVALMFCGHLGKLPLDAVALANSLGNVFGISIGVGITTASDTLFAQFLYAKLYKQQVLELKEVLSSPLTSGIIISFLAMMVSFAILLNCEALAIVLGQDHTVARMAGDYVLLLLPGLVSFYAFICLMKFVQNQNHIIPTLVIGLIANVVNIGLHYLLIYVADMNIAGSAIAQSISLFLMFFLNLILIILSGLHKTSWNGWSVECLADWGQFAKLGIFGLLMIGIEWWSFEAGIILAGLLGTTELAAQSLVFQIEVVTYMFPLGNGISTSIKVGQFLGAGQPIAAKTIARVGITFIVMTGITMGIIIAVLRNYLPLIFTNVPEVVELASTVLPIMGVYMLFDSVAGTCGGILRGSGRQTLGAVIVFIGYTIALCIGVPLMFLTPLGVRGFWLGLMIALMIVSAVETFIIFRMDWANEARKAFKRVGVEDTDNDDTSFGDNGNATQPLISGSEETHTKNGGELLFVEAELKKERQKVRRDICRSIIVTSIFVAIFLIGLFIRLFVIKQGSQNNASDQSDLMFNSTTTASL